MFAQRVAPVMLEPRLDPNFYDPRFIADEVLLDSFQREPLEGLRAKNAKISYGLIKPIQMASDCAMVRIQDFDDPFVDLDRAATVSPEQLDEFRRSECAEGDLLVAIGGYPGRLGLVGRFPPGIRRVNVNQHVVRLRLEKGGMSPYFLSTFLQSAIGTRMLQRQVTGSVMAGVNVEDLRKIRVPRLAPSVESFIAEKVRSAQALRERSRRNEQAFVAALAVPVPPPDGRARSSRVLPSELSDDLNPGRFTPDRRAVRDALNVRKGGRRLGSFCRIVAETTAVFQPQSTYLGLDAISSNSIDLTPSTVELAQVTGTSRKVRAGAAISKLRPYLNKAAYIPASMGIVVGSTELLCVVPDNGVHPAFVYGLLKLETTVRQLNPVATGATHPRIDADEVLDILVPWHAEHEALGRSLEVAQDCYRGARALVTAARLLVEALIERKVTESELIAAATDPASDRALLARLTTGGLDAAGDPLFPDLETLASLLAQKDPPDEY